MVVGKEAQASSFKKGEKLVSIVWSTTVSTPHSSFTVSLIIWAGGSLMHIIEGQEKLVAYTSQVLTQAEIYLSTNVTEL